MLQEVLQKLDLDEKEITIYLQLLWLGANRASALALRVGLPRTTVQNILLRLEHKNIVTKSIERDVAIFTAVHPDNLSQLLEMKRRQLNSDFDRTAENLKKVLPELISMMRSSASLPNVKFYQGREGIRKVLFDTLTSKTELKDYANIDAMFKYVQDINDEYVVEREKTNVKKRSLLLDTPFARKVYEGGTYSPKSHIGYKWIDAAKYPFSIEMNIYDGKISYLTYAENDFVGVIIENEHIYRMHEALWSMTWDMLP